MQACDTPLDWAKREKQHEIVRLLNNAPYIRMEVYAAIVSRAPYIRMEVYAAIVSIIVSTAPNIDPHAFCTLLHLLNLPSLTRT